MPKSVLFLSTLCVITAAALAGSSRDAEVLAHAQRLQLEFRQGNPAVVTPLVAELEAAVAQSPDNAQLWAAMGHAYMSQQGSLLAAEPEVATLLAVGERGRAAYARSLALDPGSALIRASHGMAQFVVSQLKGDGPGAEAGLAEMNAAVREAPKAITVRLTRAFTIIHLPPEMRDTEAVIEDLGFVMDHALTERPVDMLRVLLGDLHAEMGRLAQAREEYARVTGASAFAAEQVKLRLADLEKGAISPASIALVRAGTGGNCAMCHAPGTDD